MLVTTNSFSQEWVDLKDPQTALLGRPINRVNNGAPVFIPDAETPELTYEVFESTGSVSEYKEKFRSFISGLIDGNTYSLRDIQIRKLKYKSINAKHFIDGKIALNTKFAYAGQTADTVKITLRRRAKIDVDFKKLLALLAKNIPTTILGDSTSLIKELKGGLNDTLSTVISISNPNVFFKARFVEFINGNPPTLRAGGRTWDDYWRHFYNNGAVGNQEFTIIDASKPQKGRETQRYYAEYWGVNDDPNRVYFFKVKKDSDKLKLFFCRSVTNVGDKELIEIPKISENKYEFEYSLVDEFSYRGITKMIYLAVYAEQIDNNKIKIHNYDSFVNEKGKIISYMKYPEIKFKYLSRNN